MISNQLLFSLFEGDRVALPPENRDHYSEKLLLMNPCYIANDYAQVQGAVLDFTDERVQSKFPYCRINLMLVLFAASEQRLL